MPNINFPANPTQGQEFTFNNFKYIYNSNRWQSARNDSSADLDNFIKDLGAPDSKVLVAGVEAKDFIDQKDGIPATAVIWFPSRDANHEGYIPADGQLLSRALYPSLWKAIEDRKVPATVDDQDWLNNPNFRGCYSPGDGSTTFRLPDYNGKVAGSWAATFLRGDGFFSTGNVGHIQGDAIRNIYGTIGAIGGSLNRSYGVGIETGTDAFHKVSQNGFDLGPIAGTQAQNIDLGNIEFNASRVVPTSDENRPTNVTGVWMIKAFSYVENEGVVDAGHLATALADAEAKIQELEQWPQFGSNVNGYWMKHLNGVLECWLPLKCPNKTIGLGTIGDYVRWTYPHRVVEPLSVVASTSLCGIPNNGVASLRFSPERFTEDGLSVATANVSGVELNLEGSSLHLKIIGRWK